ncbi:MAG: hypothetical protein MI924_22890 [Chloroflexales bacterium]|nr:hypothetical protein [Chloroflexales bacterium]
MKKIFGVKRLEIALFTGFGVAYLALQFWWILFMVGVNGAEQNPSKMVLLFGLTGITLVYTIISTILAWRSSDQGERPVALFLMKLGLAMTIYISVGQIAAVATPAWRTPTQGIPVMYTLTMAGFIGLTLAGIGANMAWRDRRMTFLSERSKKKR